MRPTLVVQARILAHPPPAAPACGFTTTKKIGIAVVRNRARRRMKEAARLLAPVHGRSGVGYVFIAREAITHAPFPALLDDMKSALIRLAAQLDAGAAPSRAKDTSPQQTEEPC